MAFTAERICLHIAKTPQSSSSNGCCLAVIITLTNSYGHIFSHTPYLYKVGMLKVLETEQNKNKNIWTRTEKQNKKKQMAREGIT